MSSRRVSGPHYSPRYGRVGAQQRGASAPSAFGGTKDTEPKSPTPTAASSTLRTSTVGGALHGHDSCHISSGRSGWSMSGRELHTARSAAPTTARSAAPAATTTTTARRKSTGTNGSGKTNAPRGTASARRTKVNGEDKRAQSHRPPRLDRMDSPPPPSCTNESVGSPPKLLLAQDLRGERSRPRGAPSPRSGMQRMRTATALLSEFDGCTDLESRSPSIAPLVSRGPVVTEAWARSIVQPHDEYLLYTRGSSGGYEELARRRQVVQLRERSRRAGAPRITEMLPQRRRRRGPESITSASEDDDEEERARTVHMNERHIFARGTQLLFRRPRARLFAGDGRNEDFSNSIVNSVSGTGEGGRMDWSGLASSSMGGNNAEGLGRRSSAGGDVMASSILAQNFSSGSNGWGASAMRRPLLLSSQSEGMIRAEPAHDTDLVAIQTFKDTLLDWNDSAHVGDHQNSNNKMDPRSDAVNVVVDVTSALLPDEAAAAALFADPIFALRSDENYERLLLTQEEHERRETFLQELSAPPKAESTLRFESPQQHQTQQLSQHHPIKCEVFVGVQIPQAMRGRRGYENDSMSITQRSEEVKSTTPTLLQSQFASLQLSSQQTAPTFKSPRDIRKVISSRDATPHTNTTTTTTTIQSRTTSGGVTSTTSTAHANGGGLHGNRVMSTTQISSYSLREGAVVVGHAKKTRRTRRASTDSGETDDNFPPSGPIQSLKPMYSHPPLSDAHTTSMHGTHGEAMHESPSPVARAGPCPVPITSVTPNQRDAAVWDISYPTDSPPNAALRALSPSPTTAAHAASATTITTIPTATVGATPATATTIGSCAAFSRQLCGNGTKDVSSGQSMLPPCRSSSGRGSTTGTNPPSRHSSRSPNTTQRRGSSSASSSISESELLALCAVSGGGEYEEELCDYVRFARQERKLRRQSEKNGTASAMAPFSLNGGGVDEYDTFLLPSLRKQQVRRQQQQQQQKKQQERTVAAKGFVVTQDAQTIPKMKETNDGDNEMETNLDVDLKDEGLEEVVPAYDLGVEDEENGDGNNDEELLIDGGGHYAQNVDNILSIFGRLWYSAFHEEGNQKNFQTTVQSQLLLYDSSTLSQVTHTAQNESHVFNENGKKNGKANGIEEQKVTPEVSAHIIAS